MRDGDTGGTISTVSTPRSQVSTTREYNLWETVSNNQQCGLYENNTLNNQEGVLYETGMPGDQQGVLYEIDARNESSATKEAFEVTCPVSRHLALSSPESSPTLALTTTS